MSMRARGPAAWLLLAGLVVAGPAAAVDDAGVDERLATLESERAAAEVEGGRRLFVRACAACHGPGGKGDGAAASQLAPPPRDLTSRRYRFRSTATGELPRPEDLARTIRDGLPGTAMPGFGELFSAAELDALTGFLYALQTPPADPDRPPPALAVAPPSGPTGVDPREGRAIYLVSGCWSCHGSHGAGDGPASATLVDNLDRPMSVPDLRHDPLKRGRAPADVVGVLRTGLNGAPMPSYDEAMLFAAEDVMPESLPAPRFDEEDRRLLAALRDRSPVRDEIDTMTVDARAALRDRRIESLARYVISLDRRRGFFYRLFREQPEQERRR